MRAEADAARRRRLRVVGPQSLASGAALLALSALALFLTGDLPQGTLRAMGPAMLPRWLAVGVGLCGLALVVAGLVRAGHALEPWSLRGPALVVLAVLTFAVTIRPFGLGPVTIPGLGLIGAGPLTVVIGGLAAPDARLRELVALGLTLTAGCMVLFGDLLNLPIPLFPQALADAFPSGWSSDARLRVTAALMAAAGLAAHLAGTRGRRAADRTDVPGPAGRP
ncbi:hypothetical protein OPKNFCMD_2262 [Methylobacterium crusticola]|uniref:DUF1468 domain-containing protein n=1 Tax=Methylobacterium crusticola TaxID=1697972 RepID=A0ABQ4QW06_9HYPH|nr:tripartite tricarboxylate transporter TctB family protein [Methylobacterium crusticola]GJD49531.1 hypothetical protein OPKNFCMD_2262 [Methylobacterium crusticola]